MSKNNFITELRDNFIPRVEIMLSKEEEHLDNLKHRKVLQDDESKFNLFRFFGWPSDLKNIEIDSMIDYSQQMVDHLKMRLREYQEYVK